MKKLFPLLACAAPVFVSPAFGDAPVVEDVVYASGAFSVTLSHADTGWDDYADGWRVELADGTVLGTRQLAHPHVQEQPFTRSARIAVPDGVSDVFIRASDNVGGWSEDTTRFSLPE